MKFLKDDEEVVITGKELAKHRDICRKEGAISELKIIIKRNSNFKYSRLDMIEFCEKRLVKLEKELK